MPTSSIVELVGGPHDGRRVVVEDRFKVCRLPVEAESGSFHLGHPIVFTSEAYYVRRDLRRFDYAGPSCPTGETR